MSNYPKNDNSESVWDIIITVIKIILSVGLLIGPIAFVIYLFIAPFLHNSLQDVLLMITVLVVYGIANIIGEGILSLFD